MVILELTSKSRKVDCYLKADCIKLTCLQMLITLARQLALGQKYHQKK